MECVEKLIWKDMVDPVSGEKLKEKDIIPMQRVCNISAKEMLMHSKYAQVMLQWLNWKIFLHFGRVGLALQVQEWISKLKRPDPSCKRKRGLEMHHTLTL